MKLCYEALVGWFLLLLFCFFNMGVMASYGYKKMTKLNDSIDLSYT